MTRPTAIRVTYTTQDQRTTTERPLTPVRTPPPPRAAVPQANPADVCYNCNKPGNFVAQCAEPYRPRERRQPPIGVHAIADGIAVFPILADAVDVKRGDQLCEAVSQPSTQPDKVVRPMGS